ncbi:MAG: ATP-binding protein [Bacteroidetes bacterium]|jgi:predicted AAA+ superfamily ATPase|nr:ATP-binding protein [Bacteroidota bacterium]
MLINRHIKSEIERLIKYFSVLTITGPRQSGKTTLCKALFYNYKYVNLEDIQVRELIASSPKSYLVENSKGLIIDEAHYLPELFSYIQVLVDEDKSCRFVLTGSSNFSLLSQVTQSLAGRVAILNLLPLSLAELGADINKPTDELILRGGYPGVWNNSAPFYDIYRNYYNSYIERDIRQISNIKDISNFQRFIKLCAGRVGYEFNASTFANELGVSVPTIQEWLTILEASFVVFRLQPYHRNTGKRLIKSPKIYFYDTGLVCYLLGIENENHLKTYPIRGNLFENMIVIEFLKNRYNKGKDPNVYFYRDNQQKEVDIVQETGGKLSAYEIKSAKDFHKDFLKGLNYFKKLFPNEIESTKVIYDGDMENPSTENGLINFRNLNKYI